YVVAVRLIFLKQDMCQLGTAKLLGSPNSHVLLTEMVENPRFGREKWTDRRGSLAVAWVCHNPERQYVTVFVHQFPVLYQLVHPPLCVAATCCTIVHTEYTPYRDHPMD